MMSKFRLSHRQVVAACTVILTALPWPVAAAKRSVPAAADSRAGSAGKITVDPKALVLINEWKTAVSHLNSFSATVNAPGESPGRRPGSESAIKGFFLTFQRPNHLKWVSIPPQYVQIVSDGTHLYSTLDEGPHAFVTGTAPHNLTVFSKAGNRNDWGLDEVMRLLMGDSAGWLSQQENGPFSERKPRSPKSRSIPVPEDMASEVWLGKRGKMSIRAGEESTLNGELVDTIVVTGSSGQESCSTEYTLGHSDHVPRRRVGVFHNGDFTNGDVIIFSDVLVNPTLQPKTFTFIRPPTIPPGPPIRPQAQALLNKMAAAYTALHSFSAHIQMYGRFGDRTYADGRSTILMQRPNLVSCVTTTPKEEIHTVCDGTHLFQFHSSRRAVYQMTRAAPNLRKLKALIDDNDGYLSFPLSLFTDGDPIGIDMMRKTIRYLNVGHPGVVGGTPVDTIEGQFNGLSEIGPGTFTFLIGKKDHLLLQVRIATLFLSDTTTLSDVQVNPTIPASAFQFTPPPGSTMVTPKPASVPQLPPELRNSAK